LRKTAFSFLLVLLAISIVAATFKVQPVKAGGTIYINADGSVTPQPTPISTTDNVTYIFTDDIINESLVIQRNNIVLNGAGHILQGAGQTTGMHLSGTSNVTVQDTTIEAFGNGIWLDSSSSNSISGNNITNNGEGIYLWSSSNNTISGNSITANRITGGVWLDGSSDNAISRNIVIDNKVGVRLSDSANNTLRSNSMVRNGFQVFTGYLSDLTNDIDVSNTVDGKPIYYWVGKHDLTVPLDAGYVALVNCTGIKVESLNLSGNDVDGIFLAYTTMSTITKNDLANKIDAVRGWRASGNTISGNNLGNSGGIYLEYCSNNTISGNNEGSIDLIIECNQNTVCENNLTSGGGIDVFESWNNTVFENNITNGRGVRISIASANNTVWGNNIADNEYGVYLYACGNNTLFHNNFLNNIEQVHNSPSQYSPSSMVLWDGGYPAGGNYWSNYKGADQNEGLFQNETGNDGIGDTPYVIDANNTDRYPLVAPFTVFDVGTWNGTACNVGIESNSTLSSMQVDVADKIVSFNVTGPESSYGFCKIAIPNTFVQDLWNGDYTVLLNDEPYPFVNWTDTLNTYIYLNYTHSEHRIVIVPEFPSIITPMVPLIISLFALATGKRTQKTKNNAHA
jgi:parallel beta-helix repeat protein